MTQPKAKSKAKAKPKGGQKKAAKWSLDVKPFSVGPITSQGLSVNSRSAGQQQNTLPVKRYQEFFMDVTSSTSFSLTTQNVNPGLASFTPWGSDISSGYQNYMLKFLGVRFVPKVSVFNDEGSAGTVCLAYCPNATTPIPHDLQAMTLLTASVSGLSAKELYLNSTSLDKSMAKVRGGIVPGGSSVNDFDRGIIMVATVGNGAGSINIGQLYLDYEMVLMNPTNDVTEQPAVNTTCAAFSVTAQAQTTTVVADAALAATSAGALGATVAAGVISPLPGTYVVSVDYMSINTAANINHATLRLYKNAVEVGYAKQQPGATAQFLQMSFVRDVSISAGDTLKATITTTFAAGTNTANVYLHLRTC